MKVAAMLIWSLLLEAQGPLATAVKLAESRHKN